MWLNLAVEKWLIKNSTKIQNPSKHLAGRGFFYDEIGKKSFTNGRGITSCRPFRRRRVGAEQPILLGVCQQ